MTSIDVLRDQHRRIERMLTVLDLVARGVEHGGGAPASVEALPDLFTALDATNTALETSTRWARLADQAAGFASR